MCNIISGIVKDCGFSVAGNTTYLYIANAANITTTIGSDNLVTGLTGSFFRFEVGLDTLSDTHELTTGAGTQKFFLHLVDFKIPSSSNDVKNVIEDLSTSRSIVVIPDKNNQYKLYGSSGNGKSIGLDTKVARFTSGLLAGDDYGYTLQLSESFPNLPFMLSSSLEPSSTGSGATASYTFS